MFDGVLVSLQKLDERCARLALVLAALVQLWIRLETAEGWYEIWSRNEGLQYRVHETSVVLPVSEANEGVSL